MQNEYVDQLIEYALVVAGAEDYGNRDLGPIHLLKYVYLGDMAYAETHSGTTYTGVHWRFYHYGPWAEPVFSRIEPVIKTIGAERRVYGSTRYENDSIRYELVDESRRISLEKRIPFEVYRTIRNAVHKYGKDTSSLLHFVYQTKPMLQAAPNETLDFHVVVPLDYPQTPPLISKEEEAPQLSKTALRKRQEKFKEAQNRIHEKLIERKKNTRLIHPPFAPRYDEVFFEGLAALENLGGISIESSEGNLEIADEIWKSPNRSDADLS